MQAGGWRVTLEARGFGTEAQVYVPRWGWEKARDCPVVNMTDADGRALATSGAGQWDAPARDPFVVRYTVRLRDAADSKRPELVPYGDGRRAVAFARTALASVAVAERGRYVPAPAARTVELVPPRGWTCATGYGPHGRNPQRLRIPASSSNGLIAAVLPSGIAGARGAVRFSVVQVGGAVDVTAGALACAQRVWENYRARTGMTPPQDARYLLDPCARFGVQTDAGALVPLDDIAGAGPGPNVLRRIAHETFHLWLGELVKIDEPPWLKEGVTEYVALTALVETGIARREWLAARLRVLESERRTNPLADGPLRARALLDARDLHRLLVDVDRVRHEE